MAFKQKERERDSPEIRSLKMKHVPERRLFFSFYEATKRSSAASVVTSLSPEIHTIMSKSGPGIKSPSFTYTPTLQFYPNLTPLRAPGLKE